MKGFKALIFILLVACGRLIAQTQNNTCANASPFCTGQTMTYPAGVNAGVAQSGPNYGCLGSEPNPAWFFMQMATSGSVSIVMSAPNDIDFICWGPFPSLAGACNTLVSNNIQSCSYSPSATETCTIPSAIAGQFYLMLITNFSNQVQNITFNQTNAGAPGAAATNCGFVCVVSPTVSPAIICSGQAATISLGPNTSTAVTSYTWVGPGSFSSNAASNSLFNLQTTSTFSVLGTSSAVVNGIPYSGTCQAAVTVSVVQTPAYSLTPTFTSICQGGSFFAGITFTVPAANPANYSYHWQSPSPGSVWQPFAQNTMIVPPLAAPGITQSALAYTVTVAPTNTLVTCPVTQTLSVIVNNPSTPTITPAPPSCNTFTPFQMLATPGGGTWSSNAAIGSTGTFTPSLASIGLNTVVYSVTVGGCVVSSTSTLSVSRFYSPALTSSLNTVCVQDPVINLMNIVQNTLTGSWNGQQVSSNMFNPAGLPTGNYSLTYSTTSLPDPTVCPASTVLVVPVFNPPVPVIAPITPLCTNAGTMQLTAIPSGGVWSGASGVTPLGIQTPSLNAIGTNTITYTAGLGTCVASSSRTFNVSQFVSAALTGVVPALCESSSPFNLMGIVQNTNGAWSGLGTINGNHFDPTNLPTNQYSIVYRTQSIPNATLCPDTTRISVSVLNPPIPNIIQVGPFCSSDKPVQLTVYPATGHWIASSFLSSAGVFSPGLSPIGTNSVQYVIGTNTCFAQQTRLISTEAFISAALTSSVPDQCTTGPRLSLLPITASNLGTWKGPGIVGSYFDPSLSGAGTFTITYNTASIPSGLCPDKSSVSVNVYSLALPSITSAGPFCDKSMPIQLQVSPVGGLFSGGAPGAVSASGFFNPANAIIGDNIISYSISSGPCIANTLAHISVEKFISADFSDYAEAVYCINSQPFNLNGMVQNPGGVFTGPGVVVNMFDPSKANLGANTVVYQTHSTPSTLLCPDTKKMNITVKNVPVVSASSNTYAGCAPLQVVLNSSASGGIPTWYIGDGSSPQQSLSTSHIFMSPGSYTPVFNYADSDAKGCSTQVVLNAIQVYATPKANFSFSPEEIIIDNPEVTFTNLSTDLKGNRYLWTIENLGQSEDISPVINFPAIGKYQVTLDATTINGCKDETTKIVEIKNDFSVYIPNSFTPNYDGLNDVFRPVFSPYGLDANGYSLEVYDRWGHILFSSKDYNKGWDGTVQNKGEEPLKQDVYVYKLRYRDLTGQAYDKIGDVMLLR